MKKIIALAAFCLTTIAHAGNLVASMPNQNGGRIDLSAAPTPESVQRSMSGCKNTYIAKAWGNGPDAYGCWKFADDTVVVVWIGDAGKSRTYLVTDFTFTQEALDAIAKLPTKRNNSQWQ